VGASSARFNVDQYFELTDGVSGGVFPGNYAMAGSSPAGLLGLGYLHQFNHHFLLGVEATAGYMDAQTNQETTLTEAINVGGGNIFNVLVTSHLEARLTNDFALLLKPGYVSGTKTLFYALIGPRWGNFKTSAHENLSEIAPGFSIIGAASGEESGYQLGLTAGAGVQHRVSDRLHLSLEYAYTTYGEIDAPSLSAVAVGGSDTARLIDSPEIDASTNSIMLAFSYQW
jgi:opacity protein-like surface antigen